MKQNYKIAIELCSKILLAIVDLAIITAAVYFSIHEGHWAYMLFAFYATFSFPLFAPYEELKASKRINELEEENKKLRQLHTGKVSVNARLEIDAEELWRAMGAKEHGEITERDPQEPFFVPVDNGGATPI